MPAEFRFLPAGVEIAASLFPRLPLPLWRRVAAQIGMGASFHLAIGGKPACLVGFVPIGAEVSELWLMIPAASRALVSRAPALRFVARGAAGVLPSHALVARIDDRNVAGQKLALLAGFSPLDERLDGTLRRTWLRPPALSRERTPATLRRAVLQWVSARET